MNSTSRAPVLLAPPSPPGAPHIGSLYTWILLDAARRAATHFGRDSCMPQSWNMASRRLEARFGDDPPGFADYCRSSIDEASAMLKTFGIHPSHHVALRDDDPDVRSHVQAVLADLAQSGAVREVTADEKWCRDCQIALPPTTSAADCFKCHSSLVIESTKDWFLGLDLEQIVQRAEGIEWFPRYAVHRLRDLTDVHPLIRVSHPGRSLGVPSPFRSGEVIDQRLVGALWPSVVRRMGMDGPLTVIAGFDIQRKWLLTLLAANCHEALPVAVVNHGTLLDQAGRKLSRYSGASIADVPDDVEPCIVRAALLTLPLGKDLRVSELPLVGASRLRQKVLNCLRFVAAQEVVVSGVDLEAALSDALAEVEADLTSHDTSKAMATFRRAIVHELSGVLIPRIRKQCLGSSPSEILERIRSLHRVFYGDDPRLNGLPDGSFLQQHHGDGRVAAT
jgi:hypothetical protein